MSEGGSLINLGELSKPATVLVERISAPSILLFDLNEKIYQKAGINFESQVHLEYVGLITFAVVDGQYVETELPKKITCYYYGRPVNIEFLNDQNTLDIGKILLTQAGRQLVDICGSEPSEEFFSYVLSKWINENYAISAPIAARDAWKAW